MSTRKQKLTKDEIQRVFAEGGACISAMEIRRAFARIPGRQARAIPLPAEPASDKQRDLLSIEELSAKTGFSVSTLRRRMKDGTLPFIQPGGHRTRMAFRPDALERSPATSAPPSDVNTHATSGEAPPEICGPQPRWMKALKNK